MFLPRGSLVKPKHAQALRASMQSCRQSAFALLVVVASLAQPTAAAPPPATYLGEAPPGLTPRLFAPGDVSTEAVELNSVSSPDGQEFLFTRLIAGLAESEGYPGRTRQILFRMVYENGAWSAPRRGWDLRR